MVKYTISIVQATKIMNRLQFILSFLIISLAVAYAGNSHQHFEIKEVKCPIKDNLHNGYFLNKNTGWILSYGSGKLLKTTDGGESWILITLPDSIFYEDIVFVSEERGWICGEKGSLLLTRDGGINWNKQNLGDSNVAFYGIDFISSNKGILAGFSLKSGKPILFITENGGETWIQQPYFVSLNGGLEHIWFVDGKVWYIGGRGYILKSTNSGVNWYAQLLPQDAVIRGLFFFNKSEGWAVGHEGLVFQTVDGGSSWNQAESFTKNRLRNIFFINRKEGFVCGDNNVEKESLWYTQDGGRFWQKLRADLPDLHRIIPASNYLWVIGKEGQIMKLEYK